MRYRVLVAVGVAGLVVVGVGGRDAPAPRAAVVNTGVVCRPGNDSTWVDPWSVHIAEGDTVQWNLQGSDSDSITIRPKGRQAWPFTGEPPRARRGRPARSGRANRTGTYQYDIVLRCPTGDGEQRRPVVIDPDIVIE